MMLGGVQMTLHCMAAFVLRMFKQEPKGDISNLSILGEVQLHDIYKLAKLQEITLEVEKLVVFMALEEVDAARRISG